MCHQPLTIVNNFLIAHVNAKRRSKFRWVTIFRVNLIDAVYIKPPVTNGNYSRLPKLAIKWIACVDDNNTNYRQVIVIISELFLF